jgi:uncharacterized protein YhhL (DUF1145 family)
MSKFLENIALMAIGFGFATLFVGALGFILASTTFGYTNVHEFIYVMILFMVFIFTGEIISLISQYNDKIKELEKRE